MKVLVTLLILVLCVPLMALGQTRLSEGFEADTTIPPGWTVWNAAPFPIDPVSNWTVRDTGLALPGLATATSKAHSGLRAVGVSWWAGIDTNTNNFLQADAWLITPRIMNIQPGDSVRFWATGGTMNFLDSLSVWLGDVDSTPAQQVFHLASIVWPTGSTYGQFRRYAYDISIAAGLNIFVGFRYNQDIAIDGFFVHLDDISVGGPTSIRPMQTGLPDEFRLGQNYPNPFNPRTTIEFSLPSESFVTLKVYNRVGAEVTTILSERLPGGTYTTGWDATGVASGVYFYRLVAGEHAATRRLMLLK